MKPAPFDQATGNLAPPEGWTREQCGDLPFHYDGQAYVSCWEPSDEERRLIAEGAPVWLYVWGRAHPPVKVTAESPWAAAPASDDGEGGAS